MTVALLMGGVSPEREISLLSGEAVLSALHRLGVNPLVVDPGVDSRWVHTLTQASVSQVFNILHGGRGEDGQVRATLNSIGITCTGTDVKGSVIAMDKAVAKSIWQARGIATPRWQVVNGAFDRESVVANLPPPWFVKPSMGGSSTHVRVVHSANDLASAISVAAVEGSSVLVEQLVEGKAYTLSILDNQPLPLIHIETSSMFYDYQAKYKSESTRFHCPCDLDSRVGEILTAQAMRAFFALHGQHWGRVDFIVDDTGQAQFLEVNTIPGMTSHSLVPVAAAAIGLSFDEVVARILASTSVGQC